MKKIIQVSNLDCANCARKLEEKLQKVEGVNTCNVSFMMQRISLDIEDSKAEEIINNVKKVCKKVEPDMEIVRG